MKPNEKELPPFAINQIGLVVKDREKAMEKFSSIWGIGPFRLRDTSIKLLNADDPKLPYDGKTKDLKGKLAFAKRGPIELEFIEPVGQDNIWAEFLNRNGECVHHVAMDVSDLDKELERLKEKGIRILQYGENEYVKLAFLDTEETLGVIVELLQRKLSLIHI